MLVVDTIGFENILIVGFTTTKNQKRASFFCIILYIFLLNLMKEVEKIPVIENDIKSTKDIIPPLRENVFKCTEHLLKFPFLISCCL